MFLFFLSINTYTTMKLQYIQYIHPNLHILSHLWCYAASKLLSLTCPANHSSLGCRVAINEIMTSIYTYIGICMSLPYPPVKFDFQNCHS